LYSEDTMATATRACAGKHIAIYLRVSGRGQDTASQEPDLKRWANTQEGTVVWYRDKFGGKTMERPARLKLAKHIEAGKVSKLACWRLDRLGADRQGVDRVL
jgi:DNA invertase Pin-like site-specific DNA recombinase